jgi:hypothetical protein
MAKKRKRKQPTGYRGESRDRSSGPRASRGTRTPRAASTARSASDQGRAGSRQGASTTARAPSPFGSLFGRRDGGGRRPSLQPPVAVSFARGVSVVGRSPLLLAITFLAVFGLWLGFSGYGVVTSAAPQAMVLLISLPPIHTLIDIQFLARGRTVSPAQLIAFSAGLVLIRAVLMSLWVSLTLESFRTAAGPPNVRSALRRAVRSLVPMTGIELGFLTLATVAIFLVTGFLGSLGVIGAMVAGLYFFSYASVIAVAEGVGTIRATQMSMKAARVPGPQHMLLITTYLALTLFVAVITPGSRVAAATPSVAVWAFALLVGFLHVAVLAAFTYRWLLIREHALAAASEPRAGQRARARG